MLFRSLFLAAPKSAHSTRSGGRSLPRRLAAGRTFAALHALDDRTLKDIGLTRSQIESAALGSSFGHGHGR
jgi:uncharacterized protein YjiS (DUF1127 family)